MKRFAILMPFALSLLMMASAANAATYSSNLAGSNENPPNASTGTGSAVVTLDTTLHTLHVTVTFSGLTSGTTASHIHCCIAPPGNVGVATTLPTFTGFPLGVTAGSFDAVFNTTLASTWNPAFITANGGTPLGAEAALAAGLAARQAYLNIHTTNFPGGELRGFLSLQSPVVPTLSTWGITLAAAALALIGLVATRKRKAW